MTMDPPFTGYTPFCRTLTLRLGAIDPLGQGQPLPVALIECPSRAAADQVSAVLERAQNGSRTMASAGMPVYFGDTALALRVFSERGPGRKRWAELSCGRPPGGVTHSLVVVSPLRDQDFQLFNGLFRLRRSYTLSIGVGGRPLGELFSAVKYGFQGSEDTGPT